MFHNGQTKPLLHLAGAVTYIVFSFKNHEISVHYQPDFNILNNVFMLEFIY
jgi:hypothetical protein